MDDRVEGWAENEFGGAELGDTRRRARTAHLTVRHRQVTLRPPRKQGRSRLPWVTVQAILACEETPPKDAEAVEWMLLTTLPIEGAEGRATAE